MASSTSNLDLISASQAAKEATANALFDAASPATLFARRQSTTSGLTWGYYGGIQYNVGVGASVVANGTVALVPSRTQNIEGGFVHTSTTAITGISLADPCVITVASHSFAVGEIVWLDGIVGTTQLNKSFALITAVTGTTITLGLVSSVGFTAWSSGGTLSLVTTVGTTAFQVGKGLAGANGYCAPVIMYRVVTDATNVTSYTDQRATNTRKERLFSRSVAGSANITIPSGEWLGEHFEYTGALTGNIAVIFPHNPGAWRITNNTTGAFTLTVRPPTGSGVVIPQGVTMDVIGDGTNITPRLAPTQTNETANRAVNTTYTNTGGRSRIVTATFRCAITVAAGNAYVQGKSDSSTPPTTIATGKVGIEAGLLNEDNSFQISFIVAPEMKYRIDSTLTNGTATLGNWFEVLI